MSSLKRKLDEEFIELLTQHESQLLGYIYALVHDHEDASDVFQQTSLVLWKKFSSYQHGTSFQAWACRVARYEALNFLRTKRRNLARFSDSLIEEIAACVEIDSGEASDVDRRAMLAECLESLAEGPRELILRCYTGGEKIRDVAAELGRSPQSVCNSLRKIRGRLFECVDRKIAAEEKP